MTRRLRPTFSLQQSWPVALLAIVVCLLLWAPAAAQITLDADFDHGSLDEANSSVVGGLVTLAGRDNFNPGDWKWLYFSASGVAGQQVSFRIDDDFATGGGNLENHQMVFSYDQQNWEFFDNNARNAGQGTFTFSQNDPFTQDEVYVAYGLPYSYGRVVSHTNSLAASPWVTPTATADANLVIGQSPGGVDDLGRNIAPRDMFGYRITDPAATGPKKKIALISGVHANETPASFNLEGMVDFLVSDELEASILRRNAEFYVYPMVNPDGRFAGYNRSTVEHVTRDPNRFWESPFYGGLEDVKVVGDALLADTGGDVDYFIDFHSTVVGKNGHFGLVHPAFQSDPFWQTLLQLEPSVSTQNAALNDLTGQKFGRDELNAEFTMTFETQFIAGENIGRHHQLGRNFGLAFYEVLRTPADLNFDGQLNEQDWLIFIANAESDLSGMPAIEQYAAGDLDGDGFNNIVDFGLFFDAFVATHGFSAFQALFAQVPEPPAIMLFISALAVCLRPGRSHSGNS